jgi:hypothetical protein
VKECERERKREKYRGDRGERDGRDRLERGERDGRERDGREREKYFYSNNIFRIKCIKSKNYSSHCLIIIFNNILFHFF